MEPKEDSKHYILTITIGMDTCLVRHWSCSTQRARTGFAMRIAAKKKKKKKGNLHSSRLKQWCQVSVSYSNYRLHLEF